MGYSPWGHRELGTTWRLTLKAALRSYLLPRKVSQLGSQTVSRSIMCDPMDPRGARQAPLSMGFSRQECWSRLHFLLHEIFSTQGWNPCLLHWEMGSSPLSHLGSLLHTV